MERAIVCRGLFLVTLLLGRSIVTAVSTEMPHEFPVQRIRFRKILPALEFCAWISVLLPLVLHFLNGPPVTDDQAALQIATAAGSLIAALTLRVYNWKTACSA